jgi:F-type H+-transporting ATPase subunit gamma
MAGENASRLAAMHAAVKKIEEVSDALTMKYRQNRQNAITGELLDIISGFEALAQ